MRVLVTGATGRIGRNLTAALLANGATVRGTALSGDPGVEASRNAGVECFEGNLRDSKFCTQAVAGIDAVFHLGAMLLFGPEDNADLVEDNFRATFNMMEAAAKSGSLQRFIFASSDEVYPSLYAKYHPIDESHPKEPYSFYGVTKLAGEEMAQHYLRSRGLPIAIARFALTVEPWESLQPDRPLGNFLHARTMAQIVRSRAGEAASDQILAQIHAGSEPLLLARDETGTPYIFHYCDVRDLIAGLLLLQTQPAAVGEAFNLSGPSPFSYDQVVPWLAAQTGQEVVDARIPGPPIRIHHSTAKARAMLGYQPKHDIFSTLATALNEPH